MSDPELSNTTFGLTMLVVGMGGTLVTLWLLTLLIRVINAIWPAGNGEAKKD